jgi:hypothetical protein
LSPLSDLLLVIAKTATKNISVPLHLLTEGADFCAGHWFERAVVFLALNNC